MSILIQDIHIHWAALSPLLSIHSELAYDHANERLQQLLDEVGANEQHPLYELLDTLATMIHAYEEKH